MLEYFFNFIRLHRVDYILACLYPSLSFLATMFSPSLCRFILLNEKRHQMAFYDLSITCNCTEVYIARPLDSCIQPRDAPFFFRIIRLR